MSYCPICEQANYSGIHEGHCPGRLELREIEGRGPMSFKAWKTEVNREIGRVAMVGADDLADYGYWDAWDAGMTPAEVAEEVLEENGFPLDMEE